MIAPLANAAWFAANVPAYLAFRASLDDPERAQRAILRGYLDRNDETVIGRRYGFDRIASPADFASRVPIQDYDALAPDIDRIANGEHNVLTVDRVTRLATSSGSTAARKLIPYTPTLQREFNRAIGPWIVDLYARDPSLMGGPAYWSISPLASDPPPSARPTGAPPIGFEADSTYLGGLSSRLVDAVMAVPSSVRHAPDIETFRFITAVQVLSREDLRLISVWHPSFLELLLDAISQQWDQLLDCLSEGNMAATHASELRAASHGKNGRATRKRARTLRSTH